MEDVAYWKIIRVLTTNSCNFNCMFCHNEGQKIKSAEIHLPYNHFVSVMMALQKRTIKEIQFSGGEPFLNPDTIRMIEWADKHTNYELGCATNMSLLDKELIERLSKTRLSLNIQFPSNDSIEYNKVTNSTEGKEVIEKILLLKKYKIVFKLNFVWLKEEIEPLSKMIDFCMANIYGLKILPYISTKTIKNNQFKKIAIEYLESRFGPPITKPGGSVRWEINDNNNSFAIKYVDCPCFDHDFQKCKDYAEFRLLPNLEIQSCILRPSDLSISENELGSPELISTKIDTLWKSFTGC